MLRLITQLLMEKIIFSVHLSEQQKPGGKGSKRVGEQIAYLLSSRTNSALLFL